MLVVGHDEGHHNPNDLQLMGLRHHHSPIRRLYCATHVVLTLTRRGMRNGHGGLEEESLLCLLVLCSIVK